MKWDGLMQRMIRGRYPCHWLSIKDLKKRGKTRRKRVFFLRWTQYCFPKFQQRTWKVFFSSRIEMYQQEIENSKKRLQQQRAQTNSSFSHKKIVLSNVFPQKVVKITMGRKNVQKRKILSGNKSQKNGAKKKVEKRRHWSGFASTSKFTQHNSHETCNLVVRKALWRTQTSFFVLNGKKKSKHHDRDIDHPAELLHFAEHPQCLKTVNWNHLVVAWPPCVASFAKWTTRLLRLRFVSSTVFIQPLFVSTDTRSPSMNLFHCKLCNAASRSHQSFGKSIALVSFDCVFDQTLLDMSLSLSGWSLTYSL